MHTALLGLAATNAVRSGNTELRTPRFHDRGWKIVIETAGGIVSLWSCWLGDRLCLDYSKSITPVSDEVIAEFLGVTRAEAVLDVTATAYATRGAAMQNTDLDKEIKSESDELFIGYRTTSLRQWARFYGPRIPTRIGRVWIDTEDKISCGQSFRLIDHTAYRGMRELEQGYQLSHGVRTFPFDVSNKYAPDSPTTAPEAIKPYRDRFLVLATTIARTMGGARAVHIDYDFVLVPEDLTCRGYEHIDHLPSEARAQGDYSPELVRAERSTRSGVEVVMLVRGNSVVPWSTVRCVPCGSDLDVPQLTKLLTF